MIELVSHRIRRQRWACRAPTADAAMAWRAALRQSHSELTAALEAAFDAACPDERIYHLPRLELHVRLPPTGSSAEAFARQLPELVRQASERELLRLLATQVGLEPSQTSSAATENAEPGSRGRQTELAGTPEPHATAPQLGSTQLSPNQLASTPPSSHQQTSNQRAPNRLAQDPLARERAAPDRVPPSWEKRERSSAPHEPSSDRILAAPLAGTPTNELPSSPTTQVASNATGSLHTEKESFGSDRPASTRLPDPGGANEPLTYPGTGDPGSDPVTTASAATLEQSLLAALEAYLRHGVLPWAFALADPAELIPRFAALAARHPFRLIAAEIAPGSVDAMALQRLLQLLPPATWADLARQGLARAPAGSPWRALLTASDLPAQAAAELMTALLTEDHLPGPTWALLRERWQQDAEATRWLLEFAPAAADPGPLAPAIPPANPSPRPHLEPTGQPATFEQPATASSLPSSLALRWASPSATPTSLPALAMPLAGLVLLHPFLRRCFQQLGLSVAGPPVVLPRAALPRAATFLYYLALGDAAADQTPAELALGLIKPLLGLAPEDPLPMIPGQGRPEDREEAENLLRAVIGHWTILKRTTPDGLRQGFLRRPGWLRTTPEGFWLQVEGAGHDVLLRHLPWAISVVKLPWMPRPLFTEWPEP